MGVDPTGDCAVRVNCGARVLSFRPGEVAGVLSCRYNIMFAFPSKAGGCQMENLELRSHDID